MRYNKLRGNYSTINKSSEVSFSNIEEKKRQKIQIQDQTLVKLKQNYDKIIINEITINIVVEVMIN